MYVFLPRLQINLLRALHRIKINIHVCFSSQIANYLLHALHLIAKILRCPSQILMDNFSNERILLLLAESSERIARKTETEKSFVAKKTERREGRDTRPSSHTCVGTSWISIALHLGHGSNTRHVYSANERSLADLYTGT